MKKIVPADAVVIPSSAELAFQGVIFDVYQWQQELFDGSKATFEMLRRPDTITAICIVDGKILVINEEQPHRGKDVSFPGGRREPGEESGVGRGKYDAAAGGRGRKNHARAFAV